MKAVYIEQFGGPEVVKYGDLPDPTAAAGQIVVDTFAASVNGADWKVRAGHYGKATFPLVAGPRFLRRGQRGGRRRADLRVGDEVFGVLEAGREGAYAEKIAIGAAIVAKKPSGLSHVDAAALALTGLTALCSVEDSLKLKSGETILIQGGAGGVASFAIQLAKHLGARVITTASAANLSYLRDLGADQVIDYNATDFTKAVSNCDAVFDTVGGDVATRSFARSQAGRTRRLYRVRREGADARAQRRDGLAAGRRPRPAASRSRRRALPGRRHPFARGQAL